MLLERLLWSVTPARDAAWLPEDELPTVRVDVDQAETAWPAVHPGVHDADGGHRAHRVIATFRTERAEDAVLRLDYVAERGPCPDLELVLDGRYRAIQHLDPERTDRTRAGDPGPVAGGHGTLLVELPAGWLGPGEHELAITTVLDEAAATGAARGNEDGVRRDVGEALSAARTQYGKWFGSYLRWTSVRLERSDQPPAAEVSWSLRPTPLYLHSEDSPVPLVELTMNVPAGGSMPAEVALLFSDQRIEVPPAPEGRDFGMVRWRLPAPGFTSTSDFTVLVGELPVHRATLTPTRQWTLHLIPHVHLDLGFTDTQAKAIELHCRNIDKALDRHAQDPDFRYSVDGSFVVQEYLRTRSPERGERLRAAIAEGVIAVSAFHSNILTGVASLEELRRALEFGCALPPAPGAVPRYANITDVPTYTGVLPTLLHTAGVDAFVGMANHHRAATDDSDEVHLASPVRWRAPDGSEVLAHFADHYSQLRFIAADPQSVAGAVSGLERYLRRYERPDYLPSDLAIIGTHADNEDLADGDTSFVHRWNEVFAYPRARVSTFPEYLGAIEPLRDRLPVHRAEGGSFWEDGLAASAADAAAYRQAQALLPAAEQLGTIVQLLDGRYRPQREALDRAWEGLIIGGEHTWSWARTVANPHAPQIEDQLAWKRRAIDDAARISRDESRRALSQLAEVLALDGPCLLVYNPHSWPASLTVELDLPTRSAPLDAAGKPVPLEVLSECAGMRRVRLVLDELPGYGYRALPLSDTADTVPAGDDVLAGRFDQVDERTPVTEMAAGSTVASEVWQLRLREGDGLPIGLTHLPSGQQLLDGSAQYALGELVRMVSAEAGHGGPHDRAAITQLDSRYHRNGTTSVAEQRASLRLLGSRTTPDGIRLRWVGDGPGIDDIVLELLLRDRAQTCELTVEFTKQPVLDMESVSLSFPFLVEQATVRYDRQLGWVRPREDHGPGSSNEWLSASSVVTVTAPDGPGVIWSAPDNPLFSASDLVRGTWPTRFSETNGHLFAYLMNNFWPCNTPATQQGRVGFRYVFGAAPRHSSAAASRFGAEARLGALASEVTMLDRFSEGRPARFLEGSLLDLGTPADCRVAFATAADGGLRIRLSNLSEEATDVRLRVPDGYRATDSGSSAPDEGGSPVRLAPFGMSESMLVRRIPDDDPNVADK